MPRKVWGLLSVQARVSRAHLDPVARTCRAMDRDQQEDEDHQLLWMDEDAEAAQQEAEAEATNDNSSDRVAQLEAELQRTKQELSDVRKDLAAKMVQLTRREQAALQEKAQELAASVTTEKDLHLQQVMQQVTALEAALALKEEEVEETRRLYSAQKRALREALNAAAEREATEKAVDEANRAVVEQAVEDEIERLQHELALTKARAELELKSRQSELEAMKQQLAVATAHRKQAVSQAEAALTEAWKAELERVQQAGEDRVVELEAQLVRLMTQMEDARREDARTSLTSELAALNKQKVQVQREFEAFKDMAMQAARTNREEVAKLLDENASLHSRLAAKTIEAANATGPASSSGRGGPVKLFETPVAQSGMESYLPELLARIERQRKGLVPLLIVGTLVFLFLVAAVVRAALNARSQHRGSLCFLSNLGIKIGAGCGVPSVGHAAEDKMVELLDKPQRVHDVVDVTSQGGTAGTTARRLLMRGLVHVVQHASSLLTVSDQNE